MQPPIPQPSTNPVASCSEQYAALAARVKGQSLVPEPYSLCAILLLIGLSTLDSSHACTLHYAEKSLLAWIKFQTGVREE